MKRTPRCPVCKKDVALPKPGEASQFPFCSARCRQVDLGKWVMEEYRVPDRAPDEREDETPSLEPDDEGSLPH